MKAIINRIKEQHGSFMSGLKGRKGQTLVEYALILVLIVIVIIAAMQGIGQNASKAYSKVNSAITN